MPFAPKSHAQRLLAERRQASDRQRGSAAARGYDHHHRESRVRFLTKNPWCVRCLASDLRVPATIKDHIIPHRGDRKLLMDPKNWEALCKPCHDAKTAGEDGGFGRGRPDRERAAGLYAAGSATDDCPNEDCPLRQVRPGVGRCPDCQAGGSN